VSTTTTVAGSSGGLTARQVHDLVRDLMAPRPAIFWSDFLVSISIAYTAVVYLLLSTNYSWAEGFALVVSSLAFYRAAIFIHELAHQPVQQLRAFRLVWNVTCGMPCMVPLFMYGDHRTHHVNHSYGTGEDAEYLPLGIQPLSSFYLYLAVIVLLPVFGPVRFMFLAPWSWLRSSSRPWVWQYMSSIAMNPQHRRELPTPEEARQWTIQEVGSFLFGWTLAALMIAGVVPWVWLIKLYLVALVAMGINHLRALGAHRYQNEGAPMTYVEQLLDSTTIPQHWLIGELWAPLGMRFHALHHLVPSLPYHSMGAAHARLMEQLPADSPYRQTIYPTLRAAITALYCDARCAGQASPQRVTTMYDSPFTH
jgi:fatty acid desaturase